MTPEELSRIRDIYERALAMSGSNRDTFVERECHGHEETKREVERLLRAREHIPAWLDQPLVAVGTFVRPELSKMEGRRLGGYILIREIGRGGMGSVYLAERSDGAFRKQVAIKLVLPRPNDADFAVRFQREREILASLDHPYIAKLLDGGTTEEGWPYFVMEFVDGQPIHRWCDERRLNVSQRIELFRNVMAAVRYAHQHLIVHRDLKPSNILVTNDGTVKLLDFGIAKVLSIEHAGEPAETLTLARMMTPEYASPEQVNGTVITTLTDVYSLGVILYELLTGHPPYRLLSSAMHAMARHIAELEPTRPSEIVATTESGNGRDRTLITPDTVSAVREGNPNRLRRRLAGDLDSILLTALRKEPEERYGSVEAFADDLRRHLEHQPVHAREATLWYRAKRFCRRNPGGVAAAVLLVISMLAGGEAVIWQARHSLEDVGQNSHDIFLVPVWTYFVTFTVLALGATLYLFPLSWPKLLATAIGGVACGFALALKWRLEHNLGWWHSRFQDMPDPLRVLSPWTALTFPVFGMFFVLLSYLIQRRFGWKVQAIVLVAFGLYQETRERFYFSTLLPVLTYEPGLTPILGGAAMLTAGCVIGVLVRRLIAGPDNPSRERK